MHKQTTRSSKSTNLAPLVQQPSCNCVCFLKTQNELKRKRSFSLNILSICCSFGDAYHMWYINEIISTFGFKFKTRNERLLQVIFFIFKLEGLKIHALCSFIHLYKRKMV
jgi:hypothetical protein